MTDKKIERPEWAKDKKEFDFITGRTFKHSTALAYLAWGTVFGIGWVLFLKIIPLSAFAWGFWIFSLTIAFFSSAWTHK